MTVYDLTKAAIKAYSGGDIETALRFLKQAAGMAKTRAEREQIHNAKVFCCLASGSYRGK